MILRLSLDLPEGVSYIPSLRKTTSCLLQSVGVPKADVDDIELLLGELATNAVLHAQSSGYRVEIEFHSDRVVVVVADSGKGFSETDVTPEGTPRPDPFEGDGSERIGGWGLPLVRSLADRLEIAPNVPCGTRVRAEKLLHSCEPG